MFSRSAAADTQQGQAMQRVNQRWGSDALSRQGRESLGMAVCKKKYTPFVFPLEYKQQQQQQQQSQSQQTQDGGTAASSSVQVRAERRFGCRAHHGARLAVIRQHGCRPGWEPFGQWSMRKANELARKETARRNKQLVAAAAADTTTSEDEASSLDEDTTTATLCCLPTHAQNNYRSLCWNGNCLVKHASMYDDVQEEVRNMSSAAAASSSRQGVGADNKNNNDPTDEQSDDAATRTSKRLKKR